MKKAFERAAKLPPRAQDSLGQRLLDQLEILEDESRWDEAIAATQDQLERWADEAVAEFKAGKATP